MSGRRRRGEDEFEDERPWPPPEDDMPGYPRPDDYGWPADPPAPQPPRPSGPPPDDSRRGRHSAASYPPDDRRGAPQGGARPGAGPPRQPGPPDMSPPTDPFNAEAGRYGLRPPREPEPPRRLPPDGGRPPVGGRPPLDGGRSRGAADPYQDPLGAPTRPARERYPDPRDVPPARRPPAGDRPPEVPGQRPASGGRMPGAPDRGAEPPGRYADPLDRGAEPPGRYADPLDRARPLDRAAGADGRQRYPDPLDRGTSPPGRNGRPGRRSAGPPAGYAGAGRAPEDPRDRYADPLDRAARPDRGASPLDRGPSPLDRAASPQDRYAGPPDRGAGPLDRNIAPPDRNIGPPDRNGGPVNRGAGPLDGGAGPGDRYPAPRGSRPGAPAGNGAGGFPEASSRRGRPQDEYGRDQAGPDRMGPGPAAGESGGFLAGLGEGQARGGPGHAGRQAAPGVSGPGGAGRGGTVPPEAYDDAADDFPPGRRGQAQDDYDQGGQRRAPYRSRGGYPDEDDDGYGDDGWDSGDDGDGPPVRRKRRGRWAGPSAMLIIAAIILIPLVIGGLYGYHVISSHYNPADFSGAGTGQVIFQVKTGDNATTVGDRLYTDGVVASSRAFVLAAEHASNANQLEPGFYRLHKHMSAALAWSLLLNPSSRVQLKVTIPEGLRVSQIVALLGKGSGIPASDFSKALNSGLAALHLPSYANGNPEGYLYPATYEIQPNWSATSVLQAMVSAYDREAAAVSLPTAAAHGNLTPAQVIVVASLAQAEGGTDADFPKITRVIYNRLAQNMPLDLDSTVLFALNKYGIQATDQDLTVNSPYNTYKNKGLPPGPIDSPGNAAIEAALHPASGNWLYFVTVNPKTKQTLFTNSESQFEQFKQELENNLAHGA